MRMVGRDTGRIREAVEWPTVALIGAVYVGFAALTWGYTVLPTILVLPAVAFLIALHSSLQHEAIHGHPTRSGALNAMLVALPLSPVIPYRRYRDLHLRHHRNARLTDPYEDPESFYLARSSWAHTPRPLRTLFALNNTLAGRLVLGPLLTTAVFWRCELRRAANAPAETLRDWLPHLAGIAMLVAWLTLICEVPMTVYLFGMVWPGTSLILLRSFAEHQARPAEAHRTVIVETNPVLSLLFLNNNLHYLHHKYPWLAWYRLPQVFRREAAAVMAENGGYRFAGYGEVVRRYLWRRKEPVAHPFV